MKRIEPTKQYDEDGGYPSVVDVDLSRRGFLGAAAAAAAGAAGLGAALLLPPAAEAGRKRGMQKVVLQYRYQIRGCKHRARHRVEKLVVQSYDRRLIAFLSAAKERSGINAAVYAVLSKYKCADLLDAKGRAAMQRALGRAFAARYRKRRRRRVARPVVSIVVGRTRMHPPPDGGISMPSVPVPSPIASAT